MWQGGRWVDAAGEQAAPPRGAAGAGGPQQEWAGGGSDGRRDSWVDTMQPVGSGGCMDGRPSSQGAGGLVLGSAGPPADARHGHGLHWTGRPQLTQAGGGLK